MKKQTVVSQALLKCICYPPGPFTILQPQDQESDEFCVLQERLATDFEALKL